MTTHVEYSGAKPTYGVDRQKRLELIQTLLTGWINSIKGYGSTQDVIDSPHCMFYDFWTIFDKTCHSAADRATHVKGHKAKLALLRSDRHSIERSMPLATAENLLHTHSGQNFKTSSKKYDTIFYYQDHLKSDLNTKKTLSK